MCLGWERYVNTATKRVLLQLQGEIIKCILYIRRNSVFWFCSAVVQMYGKVQVFILHEDLALVSCLGKVTFNQQLFLSLSPLGRHLLKIFDSYLWIHSLLYVSDLADAM